MNIAMAWHSGDKEQVARWLDWCAELDCLKRHKLWLLPAKGQLADFRTSIPFTVLEDSYGVNTDWSTHNGPVRDAAGANSMIRQFAWHFFLGKLGPWMFCEPDAIPLRATAFDELEDEYRASGKLFMGALVPGKEGEYPEHATGNAVYPEHALAVAKSLMLPCYAEFDGRRVEMAFDIVAAGEIVGPNFHETKLIQHVFRGPTFTKPDDLARINPAAAIWHSDKDGGLIRFLRAARSSVILPASEPMEEIASHGPFTVIPSDVKMEAVKPTAHTYFRPCVDPEALAEQKRILAIWEKNWRDAGWEPVILTEAHAREHPQFEKYRKAFEALPTVSPKEYEMACWLRWVAMAATAEGGAFLVDYDVLRNLSLTDVTPPGQFPRILSDNNPVPCAVLGTRAQYQAAIDAFLTCPIGAEQGKPHLSDMLVVQTLKFPAVDICREFGKPGWENAKLIHFSHAACGPEKRSTYMAQFVSDSSFFGKDLLGVVADCQITTIRVHVSEDTIVTFKDGTTQRVKASCVMIPDMFPPNTGADINAAAARDMPRHKAPLKKKRSAIEQARINARMAKVRAAKK